MLFIFKLWNFVWREDEHIYRIQGKLSGSHDAPNISHSNRLASFPTSAFSILIRKDQKWDIRKIRDTVWQKEKFVYLVPFRKSTFDFGHTRVRRRIWPNFFILFYFWKTFSGKHVWRKKKIKVWCVQNLDRTRISLWYLLINTF